MLFFKKKTKTAITAKNLEKILSENPQIIDVREPYEFTAGHIPGAKNVPLGKIKNFVPKGKAYIVCQSGSRSSRATRELLSKGYDVVNVRGGMYAWRGKTRSGKL